MRGVRFYNNETKFAWSLKPGDKEKNAFSFGYLRRDHPFKYLGKGYDAGFIIYPHLKTPRHKSLQKVLCFFPVDANTDARFDRGCGRRQNDTTGMSRQCDAQNITTLPQWVEHYEKIAHDKLLFIFMQCGFDMTKGSELDNYEVARQANIYLQNGTLYKSICSELRFEGWDENNAKTLPIETFFYFIDSINGKEDAINYRNEFFTQSGENIPIVGIQLPTESNPNIQITILDE